MANGFNSSDVHASRFFPIQLYLRYVSRWSRLPPRLISFRWIWSDARQNGVFDHFSSTVPLGRCGAITSAKMTATARAEPGQQSDGIDFKQNCRNHHAATTTGGIDSSHSINSMLDLGASGIRMPLPNRNIVRWFREFLFLCLLPVVLDRQMVCWDSSDASSRVNEI